MGLATHRWTGAAAQLNDFRDARETRRLAGSDIDYIVAGEGPPLLILNGGTLVADTAEPLVTLFEPKFRTLTVSHPPLPTMAARVDVLLALMDREGIERASVLGQSFGGTLAQALIAHAPERVGRAVFSATASPFLPEAMKAPLQQAESQLSAAPDAALMAATRARFDAFIPPASEGALDWGAVLDQLFDRVLTAEDVRAFHASSADFFANYPAHAGTLTAWGGDALIVRADDDPALAPLEPSRLDALFPRAQVHQFVTGRHMLSVTRREAYGRRVAGFLAS